MSSKPKCFIVRPIHERSDWVIDVFINPACEDNYELVPSGTEVLDGPISASIFNHLRKDELVIAYLGAPARMEGEGNQWFWNPNVMLEAGFRMGLGLPIIFIRDHKAQENEPMLPFDLSDYPVIELPPQEDERRKAVRDKSIEAIGKYVKLYSCLKPKPRTAFPAPAVTMVFEGGEGYVESASEDAAAFFGFESKRDLTGMKLTELREKILARMSPTQSDRFSEEQLVLVGQILNGIRPVATVCLVYQDEVKTDPNAAFESAYLPVVAQFRKDNPTSLSVIYLDVSDSAKLDEQGVVRCRLSKQRVRSGK